MTNYYYKIDSIKFFCAIFVVIIHLTAFIHNNGIANFSNYYSYRYLLDIAVPFFFACSGFFLATRSGEYLKKYFKKTFLLFLSTSLFYIFVNLIFILLDRIILKEAFWKSISELFKNLTVSNFIKGTFGQFHLWFLMALILAVLALILFEKFSIKHQTILVISTIFYLISMSGFIDFSSLMYAGGFAKGLFYVAMGYSLNKFDIDIVKYPFIKFIFFIFLYEIYNVVSDSNLSQFLLAIAAFYLIISVLKGKNKETIFSKLGKYSLDIYILHVFIYKSFYQILNYLSIDLNEFRSSAINIIALIIITVILSIILYKPLNKVIFEPISKFLSSIIDLPLKKI